MTARTIHRAALGMRERETTEAETMRGYWIVEGGAARPLDAGARPDRDSYGTDWVCFEATGPEDALAQAAAYDASAHPAQLEMELFAAAYRAGALALPGSEAGA